MITEKMRLWMFLAIAIFFALLLILQGIVLIRSGREIASNYYGQPVTAVGSILIGLIALGVVVVVWRQRTKHRRSRRR